MDTVLRVTVDHAGLWAAWVPVASAAIAALAAVASWRAVIHAERMWKTGLLPELLPTLEIVDGELCVSVENAGGGPARFASFAIVVGSEFAEGPVSSSGYLRPGQGVVAATGVHLPDRGFNGLQGAVFCDDRLGQQHAWSFDGGHEVHYAHPSPARRLARWATRRSRRDRRQVVASLYSDPTKRSRG